MICGMLIRPFWQDARTGQGLFQFLIQKGNESAYVKVNGALPFLPGETPLCLKGDWVFHEDGEEWYVFTQAQFYASEEAQIKSFLTSVSKKSAKIIDDTIRTVSIRFFSIIKDEPDNLPPSALASRFFMGLVEKVQQWQKIMEWQKNYPKLPLPFFKKLLKKYSVKDAQKFFEENIYKVGMDMGLTFYQCDSLNTKHYACEERIFGAFRQAMNQVLGRGNTYEKMENFMPLVQWILGEPQISLVFLYFKKPDWMVDEWIGDEYIVYDKNMHSFEKSIAKNVNRLESGKKTVSLPKGLIDYAEEMCKVRYSDEQRRALSSILSSDGGLKILTGNPGTGKTTIINGLITIYQKLYPKKVITLCAPTGRAAQRMEEAAEYPSSTIHHLLQFYTEGDRSQCKNELDPIETDLLIIDEMSMVDVELFARLLRALKNHTMVIMTGDPFQLQSVGPGRVLEDLIRSRKIEHYHLTKVFRQKADSNILRNSMKINAGKRDLLMGKDFQIYLCDDEKRISDFTLAICKKYPEAQVLNPIKRGDIGVFAMNKKLQECLNPNRTDFIQYGTVRYYLGDKVIMIRNNPELNYCNGDMGIIEEIEREAIVIRFPKKSVRLPAELFSEMNLAYAITIHKSQGSEFSFCVILLPFSRQSKGMLVRNLLYTAVTRCKERVILIAQKAEDVNALFYSIENKPVERNSRLLECLGGSL